MNSDSFIDLPFFQENKGLITLFFTISFAFITIFYLYTKLQTTNENRNTVIIPQNNITKKRLTINAKDILFKDFNKIDISKIYPILDKLSKIYDLYLIIMV